MFLVMKVLIITCLCFTLVLASPTVKIQNGTLQGSIITTRNGREIFAFQGIPYARPPINELRFELPYPADAWKDVRIVQKNSEKCIQKDILNGGKIIGSEDCLYINVYSPKLSINNNDNFEKKLPVMFWLHGGGWYCGSANSKLYGPKYLLDHDVVLVTVNYRLGPLGFLSTEDMILPGNLGMKDQVQALRWVKENIAAFGGNPNELTLFGESAGGASVHYHMISPLSKGLFQRAISQSGTINCPWALNKPGQAKEKAFHLGYMLNCSTSNSAELIACLRKIDAADIIKLQEKFATFGIDPIITFRPVIEPNHPGGFLIEDPDESLRKGNINDVPWMTGINLHEGAIRILHMFSIDEKDSISILDKKWSEIAPISLLYEHTCLEKSKDEIMKNIREFYFGNKIIDKSSKSELINIYTDAWFGLPAYNSIKIHRQKFSSPVYFYHFSYRGRYSLSNLFSLFEDYGVCHGDELQYIFPIEIRFFFNLIGLPISTEDENMIKVMTNLWYNFAKTGNPTPDVTEKKLVKWLPVQSDNLEYLEIGNSTYLKMSENLNKERMNFWESTMCQKNLKDSNNQKVSINIKEEL